jgi:hypothetical protein
MADIKQLKDAVWLKQEEIKKEEAGLQEWSGEVCYRRAQSASIILTTRSVIRSAS